MSNDIVKAIEEKYKNMGQDPNTYLKGLLHSKLINYWDYVEVDTLLSLQKPRTDFTDEPIFIMYHQVTELLLKLITHEIKQIVDNENIDTAIFSNKIDRINRYSGILTESFAVMREGMDYDQYNQFRLTLAPASGFQSAQFRFIELYCTDAHLLVNSRVKAQVNADSDMNYLFDNLYWKDAGLDHTYNVVWPLSHLKTAEYYLNSKGENKAATGGSEWQKYLHPSYQRRIFFPELWTKEEIENWGK